VLEINAAVDFDETYSLPGRDVFTDIVVASRLAPADVAGRVALASPL
jgi:hypothetical protein